MDLSEDYDSLYDPRGQANLVRPRPVGFSGKISVKILSTAVIFQMHCATAAVNDAALSAQKH